MVLDFTEWTIQNVRDRVIEAAETIEALPPIKRPKEYGNALPEVVREIFKDFENSKTRYVRIPSPGAISRMEQTWDWINSIESQSDRQLLYAYGAIKCRKGRTISAYCHENRFHKRTFERLIRKLFQRLADDLNRNTMFREALPELQVSHFEENGAISMPTSQKCTGSWMAPGAKPIRDPEIKQIKRSR